MVSKSSSTKERIEKMSEWKFIETDGNPAKRDEYDVIVIYDDYYNGEKTGKTVADYDKRFFDGRKWIDPIGSNYGEYVYAWREIKINLPALPAGVKWEQWIMESKAMNVGEQ
jgi:hypothetical protein